MKIVKSTGFSVLMFSVLLFFGSCKAQKSEDTQDNPESFLILLKENYEISDIKLLSQYSVESAKKTSRSQNLWLVKVMVDTAEKEELITALQELKVVSSVSQPDSEGTTNAKNKDKKSTKPKNN